MTSMMERRTGATATLRRMKRLPPPRAAMETPSSDAFEAEQTAFAPAPSAAAPGGLFERPAPPPAASSVFGGTSRAPAAGVAPAASHDPAVGIAEFGQILARRWKLIALTTLLATLAGIAFALLAPKKYTATTSIFIDPRARAAFQIEATGMGAGYDPNLVDSQTVLIESETVLRRVINAERLAQDPDFSKGNGDPIANALKNLKDAVKVKRPERTYVVDVQVRAGEAEKAARIANAIARAYLSDGSDTKTDTVNREQGWLDKHLAGLEQRLRQAEARVDEYKTRNRIYGSPGGLVGEQQLSEINRALADAQRKAAESKATLDQVEMLRRNGKLPDATNEALRSGTIERLRTQQAEILRLEANSRSTLGPRHPASIEVREQLAEIQRQISAELGRIAENARSAYSVARANVQGLEREMDRLKKNSSDTNHTLLGLRELERAVEAQKAVYEKFLRDKEAIARLSVETPAGRIIQAAVAPPAPSFPNRPLVVVLALVGGLFLGVGLALFMETLARARGDAAPAEPEGSGAGVLGTIRQAAAARTSGKATVLAMLPAAVRKGLLGGKTVPHAPDAVLSAPKSPYAKAITALAGQISANLGNAPATMMVSGVEAGAANPTLALNLGLALAQAGRAVLLVDGNGGAGSLTELLTPGATPVEILVSGRRQGALMLAAGVTAPLYLLPFGAPPRARQTSAPRQVAAPDITLIDGPALRSSAFARLDLDRAIDGVLAVMPPGMRAPDRALTSELRERLGPSLVGLVGQGA